MLEHASATPASAVVRRSRLLELLEREGEQPVERLAETFGVSAMTIRRDLQDLASEAKIIRTHGGAAPAARVSFDFRFLERAQRQSDEKAAIAELAEARVRPGQSVLLDSGTTTLAIARRLKAVSGVTVITTSLPIASELFGATGVNTILLGGQLRHESPDLYGAITDHTLDVLRADVAFLGADAIDPEGNLYNASAEIGRLIGRMAAAAAEVYAVADHTKIGRHDLMRFARLRDWTALLTDAALDPSMRRVLESAGATVVQPETGDRHQESA